MAADFKLVQKLREESKQKFMQSERMIKEANDLGLEIRAMESQIDNMKANIDRLVYESHKLRTESDRLKNQAFVMSLGEPNG